jgi:hypothetical protein
MNGREVLRLLDEQLDKEKQFIKWWRKENDFVDIELIETFRDRVDGNDDFSGFELLDMEQLWAIVTRLCPGRVERQRIDAAEVIVWDRVTREGVKTSFRCSFAPEFLIQIFDVETRGNYIE